MTWADRLFRLAIGDPHREVAAHLAAIQQRSTAQEQRLAAAAAQAPTAAAESELRALAAREGELSAAVAGALRERAAASAPQPGPPSNGAARNHWARLVTALEGCQAARAQLLRDTPHLLELDATLADLLRTLLGALDREVVGLRALIARADPHSIN
jgi:hypothetical protein